MSKAGALLLLALVFILGLCPPALAAMVASIAAGGEHTVALNSGGTVGCAVSPAPPVNQYLKATGRIGYIADERETTPRKVLLLDCKAAGQVTP